MKKITNLHGVVLIVFLGLLFLFLSSCSGGGSGTSAAPPAPNPVVSVGVSAVAGDNKVSLGWSSLATAVSYDIYSSTSSTQAGSKIASVAAPTTMYIDNSATNGTTYYYVVKAKDSGGVLIGTSTLVTATPSASAGSITVSGTVLYQDKEYGDNGFTGNQPYKAVRYAAVELVSASTNTPLVSTLTDSSGFYSISTSPTTTVYVRVNADATLSGATPQVVVKNLSAQEYGVAGNEFLLSGPANVNISIPASSVGGAFNILDVFTNGIEFVHNYAGNYPTSSLIGYWKPNNCNGTYFDGSGIYILNNQDGLCPGMSGCDTDEYDDDVLYHEFGHFTAAHFSKDDSRGGIHYLTSNDLDMRLAWSEGWGDSMPGNVKTWLSAISSNLLSSADGVALTEYVDTISTGAGIAIDMDKPDASYPSINPVYFSYACGEVAVAKILLDLNKDFGMNSVWSVIHDFQVNAPVTPVNLELFWDRWHSLGELTTAPASTITIDSIFVDRRINYSSDSFEPDGAILSSSTYTGPQNHTFYAGGDVDLVSFNTVSGQQYTITTSGLKNGADTFLRILDQSGTFTGFSNDTWNNSTYSSSCNDPGRPACPQNGDSYDSFGIWISPAPLSSKVIFTAPTAGIYYVEVSPSPIAPPSAGRYGSYTLIITSP